VAEPLFELVGGRLSLDFVNTVSGLRGPGEREKLLGYADLLVWARAAGLLGVREAAALGREAQAHPRKAEQALLGARRLREAIFGLVEAAVNERPPPQAALDEVNRAVSVALAGRRLRPLPAGGFALGWEEPAEGDLLWFLRPVAASAVEVLATDAAGGRLRMCEQEEACSWVFVDESRNGRRRWCSMKDCGNRAKARRFYERHKS
jgi:predicted RNA-binding Zn ribbon-like protein